MNNEKLTIHDLPEYWQEQIRKLRVENRKLRQERNLYRDLIQQRLVPSEADRATGTIT